MYYKYGVAVFNRRLTSVILKKQILIIRIRTMVHTIVHGTSFFLF